MRKLFVIILLLFFCNGTFAVEILDDSIDSDIRKEYNVENSTLPSLPNAKPSPSTSTVKIPEKPQYNPTGKKYEIKNGTKVELALNSKVTDYMPKGSIVSFSARNGFTTKEGEIIPAGTIFKGRIINSHTPQITGNGGLVALQVDEIYFNGLRSPIETKIMLANYSKVPFGNIKGKRSYWTNCVKSSAGGKKFYNSSKKAAKKMGDIPIIGLLSPIPFLVGAIVYDVNIIISPVISIFKKGGHVSLPKGTLFEIKFTDNTTICG